MKAALAGFAVVFVFLIQDCLAETSRGAGDHLRPLLYFHAIASDRAYGSVDLQGLDPATLAQLRRSHATTSRWQSAFPIFVSLDGAAHAEELPAVLGRYTILQDRVRFTPDYAPVAGVSYRASANLSVLLGSHAPRLHPVLTFALPQSAATPSTVVESVFPSGDVLPENLMRFYIYFSAPMQRGNTRDQIALLSASGQRVLAPFYNPPVELWDPAMKRLTILLDPGRIKRGVGPNVELGPPLRQGDRYVLVINSKMADASGRPLRQIYTKSFRVSAPAREPLDPRRWSIHLPHKGTREPVVLDFPVALDRALLSRLVRVVNSRHSVTDGLITVDRHETQWSFVPALPWSTDIYEIQIAPSLEDVSGNTTWAPFDTDTRSDAAWRGVENTISLRFAVMAKKGPIRWCVPNCC